MKHAEKRSPYVFDPKTKLEFVKPRSITWIDSIVTIRVPMTKKEVTAYIGKPCKDHEVGCPTCDAWEEWHEDNRVAVKVDRQGLVALIMKGTI
jgi:hypothetical protein